MNNGIIAINNETIVGLVYNSAPFSPMKYKKGSNNANNKRFL